MREFTLIPLIRSVALGCQLIGSGCADLANDAFERELMMDQSLGKMIQQFWIGRGIANAHVVHRIHDAHTEEMRPDDVGNILREGTVFMRSNPLGEHLPIVLTLIHFRNFSPEEFWKHSAVAGRMEHFSFGSHADKACPTAPGCDLRVAIPYDDPKVSDGTPSESATYDKRGEQIAREMLYVMSLVHQPNVK